MAIVIWEVSTEQANNDRWTMYLKLRSASMFITAHWTLGARQKNGKKERSRIRRSVSCMVPGPMLPNTLWHCRWYNGRSSIKDHTHWTFQFTERHLPHPFHKLWIPSPLFKYCWPQTLPTTTSYPIMSLIKPLWPNRLLTQIDMVLVPQMLCARSHSECSIHLCGRILLTSFSQTSTIIYSSYLFISVLSLQIVSTALTVLVRSWTACVILL
jgi:hypothetical protein